MSGMSLRSRAIFLITLFSLILSVAVEASAQISSNADIVQIRVREVSGKLAFYNTITVEVDNLLEYLDQTRRDPSNFVLYLDWRPIKGLATRHMAGTDRLQFDIARTEESRREWNALLGKPFSKGFSHPVAVSIGYQNDSAVPTIIDNKQKKALVIIQKGWFFLFLLLIVPVALLVFKYWAKVSGLIRDPFPEKLGPNENRPFSLARTQMAIWFIVIFLCYSLIWMTTSDLNSLTGSTLVLLGISAFTALGGNVVESGKLVSAKSSLREEERKEKELLREKEDLGPALKAAPESMALIKRMAEIESQLLQAPEKKKEWDDNLKREKSSGNFFEDILTDFYGYSLSRIQIAIWTVALVIMFVASVYNSLMMPQFNDTLLALMGISGGTYVGFKLPEKQG